VFLLSLSLFSPASILNYLIIVIELEVIFYKYFSIHVFLLLLPVSWSVKISEEPVSVVKDLCIFLIFCIFGICYILHFVSFLVSLTLCFALPVYFIIPIGLSPFVKFVYLNSLEICSHVIPKTAKSDRM
jgi:hypothetical protein